MEQNSKHVVWKLKHLCMSTKCFSATTKTFNMLIKHTEKVKLKFCCPTRYDLHEVWGTEEVINQNKNTDKERVSVCLVSAVPFLFLTTRACCSDMSALALPLGGWRQSSAGEGRQGGRERQCERRRV